MKNPIEKSLENMAEISKQIMLKAVDRGELTEADVLFLTMYQKEKARAMAVPLYKKIIGGVKEVSGVIKELTAEMDKAPESSITTEYTEVDTDEL